MKMIKKLLIKYGSLFEDILIISDLFLVLKLLRFIMCIICLRFVFFLRYECISIVRNFIEIFINMLLN